MRISWSRAGPRLGRLRAAVRLEVVGQYRLAPGSRGLEVRRASAEESWRVVSAAAGITVVAALVMWLRGSTPGNVVATALAASCLVALAIFTRLDRVVWHANPTGLSRDGFAGRRAEWRAEEIQALEVREVVSESSSPGAESWAIGVRFVDGGQLRSCFELESREEAEALASAVVQALEGAAG